MTQFPTPRIVIVDDDVTDATPLLRAFSHLGTSAAWYNCDGEIGMPKNPYSWRKNSMH